jgi:hypothetical protein
MKKIFLHFIFWKFPHDDCYFIAYFLIVLLSLESLKYSDEPFQENSRVFFRSLWISSLLCRKSKSFRTDLFIDSVTKKFLYQNKITSVNYYYYKQALSLSLFVLTEERSNAILSAILQRETQFSQVSRNHYYRFINKLVLWASEVIKTKYLTISWFSTYRTIEHEPVRRD